MFNNNKLLNVKLLQLEERLRINEMAMAEKAEKEEDIWEHGLYTGNAEAYRNTAKWLREIINNTI